MKLAKVLTGAGAALALCWGASAVAGTYTSATSVLSGGTLITFEDLSNGTLVDTQYSGVTFGQAGGGRPQIDQYPWLYGYGASSGDHVLTGSTEGTGHVYDTVAGLTAAFATGQSAVEFFFSDASALGDYPITFYGEGGSVLGAVTLLSGTILPVGYTGGYFPPPGTSPLPGIFVGFTSAGNDIFGVGIGPSSAYGDSYAIDDLRFSSMVLGVPEPASWALMLIGFGALGAMLRRSRRAVA